jgi:uncharacterized protein
MFPVAVRTESWPLPLEDRDHAARQGTASREAIIREIPDFIARINKIVQGREPIRDRIARLHRLADRVSRAVAPYSPCKSGCSSCCYQAVVLPPQEAQYIGSHIKRKAKQPKRWITTPQQVEHHAKQFNTSTPCPFLKDGNCSIYEHRPLACRTHINMTRNADPCDLSMVRETAALDLRIFDQALMRICQAYPADLRDYFPPRCEL